MRSVPDLPMPMLKGKVHWFLPNGQLRCHDADITLNAAVVEDETMKICSQCGQELKIGEE